MAKEANNTPNGGRTRLRVTVVLGVITAVMAALVFGGYLYTCAQPEDGVLLMNTYVNGVDISGMTETEANAAVQKAFQDTYAGASAQVALADETYTVSLWDDAGGILTLDPSEEIQNAMLRGHGSFFTRGVDWVRAHGQSFRSEVAPAITQGDALTAAIAATGIGEVNTTEEHSYEIGEDSISIHKGGDGVKADMDKLPQTIVEAFQADPSAVNYTIDCPTVEYGVEELDLQSIYDQVHHDVADATVDPEHDYAIVPAEVGVSFDLDAAREQFEQAEKDSDITIALEYTQPEVTTAFLEEHLFADELGSFATSISGSSGRHENVRLAASKCNGVVLMPGEQFSYNQTVGQRTTERGFSEAGAYLNGELVMEVGGGICQSSSTLYMAAVMSNLQIDQRSNHTFPSSYIGLGIDATVSWGGPDLKFTNNTKFPIKITSRSSYGKVSFTIYGSKQEDFSVEVVSEVLKGSGTGRTYHSGTDSTNSGVSIGYTGKYAEVQTYRKVYDGDGKLISNTKEAYSYYKTHEED